MVVAYDERLAERIRVLLRGRRQISERKMFGGLAFLRDGRMFCGIAGADLMVRVVAAEMPDVMGLPHVRPMDFTGRPLKGFVSVGPRALVSDPALAEWIERGLAFAESDEAPPAKQRPLKPKSSTRASRRQ